MSAGAAEPAEHRVLPRRSTARLETARLVIDPLSRDDLPELVAYRRLPEVAALRSWGADFSISDAERLLTNPSADTLSEPGAWVQWALRWRNDRAEGVDEADGWVLVGDLGTGSDPVQPETYELGVTLNPAYQGRGLAAEAVEAVADWLMDHRAAHRLIMQMDARNRSMIALAERLGWRHEGAAVDGDWFKGEWTTLHRYALLRQEWRKARPQD